MVEHRRPIHTLLAAVLVLLSLLTVACGGDDADDAASEEPIEPATEEATPADSVDTDDTTTTEVAADGADTTSNTDSCDELAAQFVTRGSANADLPDPEVEATCDGDTISVVSNGVPDFTYIGTSPGAPDGREFTFALPATATLAETVTDIPYIGPIGVSLSGIAIYGPTEGTGGDVDSLPGIISACGSHNGPGGFHTHKILTSVETDCWFTPEEVAAEPQLAGYAFDGYPIYTGNDQYTSSWQLTDESLFATDTWAAHTYVEGSGDLDQCNGRVDENGDYAYYTTDEFPYVLGCFAGVVDLDEPGGDEAGNPGQGGDRPERPEPPDGEGGDRPEPPEGDDERPEPRPEDDAGA